MYEMTQVLKLNFIFIVVLVFGIWDSRSLAITKVIHQDPKKKKSNLGVLDWESFNNLCVMLLPRVEMVSRTWQNRDKNK